jgi:hypothetical protein
LSHIVVAALVNLSFDETIEVEEFMGDRPPTLSDYLDDDVGVDTFSPITTKMIVIQALEMTPLG